MTINSVEAGGLDCILDCCKSDSPNPTRLEVSREATCREYGKGRTNQKRYFNSDLSYVCNKDPGLVGVQVEDPENLKEPIYHATELLIGCWIFGK
jgi:hypothetical protein